MRCLNHLAFPPYLSNSNLSNLRFESLNHRLIGKLGKPVSAQRMDRLRESAFGWLRGCATCRLHPRSGLKFQLWKVQFNDTTFTLNRELDVIRDLEGIP